MKFHRIADAWTGQAECQGCSIRELALFADLQLDDFNLIHLPIDELTLAPGEALYHAGDDGLAVFTLRSGLVKLIQYLPDGCQRIVRLLRPGDTLGLEVLLGGAYEHTAQALRPAHLCRIPRDVVHRLSVETPRLHEQLMKRWHRSVQQADDWLTGLSTGSAKARVARLLLFLSSPDILPACHPHIDLPTREDVGAMLGVTTETASRIIAEFKRGGLLTSEKGGMVRCNRPALERIADYGAAVIPVP